MLCGGVRWRRTDTCINVVIQSAREGGREGGRRKKSKEKQRRREKGEGGLDAAKKLGQIHFQGLIPTKVFVSVPMGGCGGGWIRV